ncbi:MAG: transcription antitermination factor NusB [Terriglobia bacterium]
MPKTDKKGSNKAQGSAARLAAVQALYQMEGNAQTASSVIREYMDFRFGEKLDGEAMVTPDGEQFSRLVSGVAERKGDLDHMIAATLGRERPTDRLLSCILLCGAWELLARTEIDAPVIISDYLHVTEAFYDQGEKKLVNAVLDKIAANVRDKA